MSATYAAVVKDLGQVDMLVNNAGQSAAMPFEQVTDQMWEEDLALKLYAAIRFTRLAFPDMKSRRFGRVINVLATAAKAPAAAAGRQAPRVEKLSSMRRTIARRLSESKQTVPHFYLTMDVDAGPLMEARAQINAELADDGEKVSVNDLVIKACAVALAKA